jgi:hypothetical protein
MKQQSRRDPIKTSSKLRFARLRGVALLIVAWAFSGVWTVGHALAHEMDHASGDHIAEVAEDSVVSITPSHGHGHSHPNSPAAVSAGKAPRFDAPAVLAAAPDFECEDSPHRRCTRTPPARASPSTAAASGPRAPPLS